MKTIMIATGNPHKVKEFKEIFDVFELEINLVSPKDYNDDSEPIEDGNSYKENSLIKAKFFYDKYHIPTLADDSGIEIDFYDGKPGIYSARFLKDMSYEEKNIYITNEMKGSNNRGARFMCCVTYIENDEIYSFEGILNGTISDVPVGDEGFGYDPIFIPNGYNTTNAVLGQEFKNTHCHRAIALRKWADFFENK